MNRRVTGIGGIFFKAKDPKALGEWYWRHLGIEISEWGGAVFQWKDDMGPTREGTTIFSLFPADTKYFDPGVRTFMINLRVADLAPLLEALRAEGCAVQGDLQESEFGRFGWVLDPEGNKVELWEPPPV